MENRVNLTLRVAPAMLAWLESESRRLGVTRSELLRLTIKHGLDPATKELTKRTSSDTP